MILKALELTLKFNESPVADMYNHSAAIDIGRYSITLRILKGGDTKWTYYKTSECCDQLDQANNFKSYMKKLNEIMGEDLK